MFPKSPDGFYHYLVLVAFQSRLTGAVEYTPFLIRLTGPILATLDSPGYIGLKEEVMKYKKPNYEWAIQSVNILAVP